MVDYTNIDVLKEIKSENYFVIGALDCKHDHWMLNTIKSFITCSKSDMFSLPYSVITANENKVCICDKTIIIIYFSNECLDLCCELSDVIISTRNDSGLASHANGKPIFMVNFTNKLDKVCVTPPDSLSSNQYKANLFDFTLDDFKMPLDLIDDPQTGYALICDYIISLCLYSDKKSKLFSEIIAKLKNQHNDFDVIENDVKSLDPIADKFYSENSQLIKLTNMSYWNTFNNPGKYLPNMKASIKQLSDKLKDYFDLNHELYLKESSRMSSEYAKMCNLINDLIKEKLKPDAELFNSCILNHYLGYEDKYEQLLNNFISKYLSNYADIHDVLDKLYKDVRQILKSNLITTINKCCEIVETYDNKVGFKALEKLTKHELEYCFKNPDYELLLAPDCISCYVPTCEKAREFIKYLATNLCQFPVFFVPDSFINIDNNDYQFKISDPILKTISFEEITQPSYLFWGKNYAELFSNVAEKCFLDSELNAITKDKLVNSKLPDNGSITFEGLFGFRLQFNPLDLTYRILKECEMQKIITSEHDCSKYSNYSVICKILGDSCMVFFSSKTTNLARMIILNTKLMPIANKIACNGYSLNKHSIIKYLDN